MKLNLWMWKKNLAVQLSLAQLRVQVQWRETARWMRLSPGRERGQTGWRRERREQEGVKEVPLTNQLDWTFRALKKETKE